MHIATISVGLASALALAACAGSQKTAQLSPHLSMDCSGLDETAVSRVYAPGAVKEVTPLYRREFLARAIQPVYVSGAALLIPAQAGMTDAHFERALSCHAASRSGIQEHPIDPLRVPGVENVNVKSAGTHTRIAITSNDPAAAKQILQSARTLKEADGSVSVEQLSNGMPPGRVF